jgi:hypothetical protein
MGILQRIGFQYGCRDKSGRVADPLSPPPGIRQQSEIAGLELPKLSF